MAVAIGFLSPLASAQYPASQGGSQGDAQTRGRDRDTPSQAPPPLKGGPRNLEPGAPAAARAWEIVPSLTVGETYTDNARLSSTGNERGDWITQLRPGVSIIGNGPRFRLNANYSAEVLHRAQEGGDDIYHYLNAQGNAELVRRLFFIDADAHITQQNISLLGPQAQSNVNVTGNRTSVRTVRVSPYLKHEFGSDAVGELRFTNTTADSSGSTAIATDSVSNRIDLRFASGPAYKLLTWFVAYSKEYIDYTNIQDLDIETITASASRLVTPQFAVRANVGYENNNYLTAGAEPKGSFWSIGPEWRPTPRTKLSANTGRRFFGSTHFLDFTHRSRLTTWKVNYSEDISTTRQQLFIPIAFDTASILDSLFLSGVPDPVLRQQVVQTFIALTGLPTSLNIPVNFFTTSTFLVKRLTGSVGIQGTRNTLLGTVFSDSREAVSIGQSAIGDFTNTNDIKQTGASLSWSLRLAANASSNLSISYARNQFPSLGREDDLKTVQWGLTRQFQPRVSGTLTLRRLENDSNQISAGYTENQVAALLTMRF